ncbi:MAG: hypothetical protein MR966_06620, partial [Lachnospiraceae bacterium]|nr:hypothetical protein [Lachnospiraceae bacterium]
MNDYRNNEYSRNDSGTDEPVKQEPDISRKDSPEAMDVSSARSQLIYDTGEAFLNDSPTPHNIHLLT